MESKELNKTSQLQEALLYVHRVSKLQYLNKLENKTPDERPGIDDNSRFRIKSMKSSRCLIMLTTNS